MSLTQFHAQPEESYSRWRIVNTWTSLPIFQKAKKIRGRTHLGMCRPTFLTSQHNNSSKHGSDSSQKSNQEPATTATACFASSNTETSQETEPDWTSSDTALEVHFEIETGKHTFQNICRDMCAFVTSATRTGRKEVFERQVSVEERRQLDPAKQKEINNNVVNDVLEKLEARDRPQRVLEYRLDENENKSPKAHRDIGIS